jgi:polysaccharide pyruvyl transferase WcaK-like protein
MKRIRLIQISNGVGSGNIGDELMAQEFWKLLPGNVVLNVPVLPEASRFRGKYPAPHHYFPSASHRALLPAIPGLLVGDTPVAESEGLAYPLEAVGPQISAITGRGLPVDAIGVGVERLYQPEARELFARYYSAIRSWTVRSAACREALLDLGIAPEKIRVAADLAWLFAPGAETDDWAEKLWRGLGVQRERPLLVVNLVHQANPGGSAWQLMAEALDQLARNDGCQVAFLHNETRPGPYFDAGATAAVRALMREPSMEVPAAYYTPQEMVSLLRWAKTVLSQRYHMAIQAILAGTVPVCLERGQKLSGLAREFGLPTASLAGGSIVAGVQESMARRTPRLQALAAKREEHRVRAGEVLSFFREYLEQAARMQRRRSVVERVVIIHLGGLGGVSLPGGVRRRSGAIPCAAGPGYPGPL